MRTNRRICHRLASTMIVVTAVAAAAAAPASAEATSAPRCLMAGVSAADLNEEVAAMRVAGLDQKSVDRELASRYQLQLVSEPAADPAMPTEDMAIEAVSTGNDVMVGRPALYRDTCASSYYYYIVSYSWRTMSRFRSEWPLICGDPCALSGTDGFGISLNRNVNGWGGYSMTTWGYWYFGRSTGRTWLDTNSASGLWFEGVDHFKGSGGDDFSFHNGQIVFNITDPGCGPLAAVAKYSHTWSDVSINNVSIGYLAIGLGWTSSSNRWGKSGEASSTTYFC